MKIKRNFWISPPDKGVMFLLLGGLSLIVWLMVGVNPIVKAAPPAQSADEGQAIFEGKCAACHTIGGGTMVGPDLEGVTDRRGRDWLMRWIAEPDEMLAQGDSIATEMLQEYNNVPMPNLALTEAEVAAVLLYLENPGGAPAPLAILPEGDRAKGRSLFTGGARLQNGAPPCMSCHSVADVGAMGGGTLGPDLTKVYTRYGDNGLASALKDLPFPTMQGVFADKPLTENESSDLYAYFIQVDQAQAFPVSYNFVWIGLVGFVVLVISGVLIWRRRLIAVRKPLLGGVK